MDPAYNQWLMKTQILVYELGVSETAAVSLADSNTDVPLLTSTPPVHQLQPKYQPHNQ